MSIALTANGWTDRLTQRLKCTPEGRAIQYCKFGNFRENIIFANSVKRHICDVKNLLPWHDLPISVNDRVISPFREDFILTKLCICSRK